MKADSKDNKNSVKIENNLGKKQKYEGEGECRSGVQAGAVGKSV